jgi:peptidoglycan hydrolase-like protein with peptidoglycan-binding domain
MPAPPPAPVIADAAAPVAPDAPAPAMERAGQAELNASEIWELQARLEFLGMRPGSLDGIPGPQTTAAIRRYEESRGQADTGKLDRKLLEQLRGEPQLLVLSRAGMGT